MTSQKKGTSSVLCQALCIISKPSVHSNWSYSPETLTSGQNWRFLSGVTLNFDGWPWKTKGRLFFATSSFTHHFVAIREFKLELQSGNVQFGSSMMTWSDGNIFRVTGPLWGGIHWSLVNSPHKDQGVGALMFSLICSWTNGWVNNRDAGDVRRHCAYYGVSLFKLTIFVLFDLEVWRMTLKNNRAPMPHQALCMISSPYINSNWSYGPERLNWVLTYVTLTCDLDLVHGYHFCHW